MRNTIPIIPSLQILPSPDYNYVSCQFYDVFNHGFASQMTRFILLDDGRKKAWERKAFKKAS